MKQLGVSLLHRDGLPVHHRVTSRLKHKFDGTHFIHLMGEMRDILETMRVVSFLHRQLVRETDVKQSKKMWNFACFKNSLATVLVSFHLLIMFALNVE